MLLLGQKYTYADGITKPVITNVYIFRHGRVTKDKDGDYLVLKKESETEIKNSAEKISCDSDTSQKYRIFYLQTSIETSKEKDTGIRFKQTADQIVKGLNNRESCNYNSNTLTEAISVTDTSKPNYDDLQKVWNKITTEEPPEEPNSSNNDENLKNYNKIFVLSGQAINALLRPNVDQCPPKKPPCFMENWQAVHDVIQYNQYEYNHRYSHESKYKKPTDFLYAMILYLRLHKMTEPYHSILPVGVEKISIDSEPPLSK